MYFRYVYGQEETPPRAWRRRNCLTTKASAYGNTSTCVEKTTMRTRLPTRTEKHLHVRGEDSETVKADYINWETPPRAWRRLFC